MPQETDTPRFQRVNSPARRPLQCLLGFSRRRQFLAMTGFAFETVPGRSSKKEPPKHALVCCFKTNGPRVTGAHLVAV